MLSRVISDLVAAGLVARTSDDGDRRAAWVTPTAAGRKLAERIRRERTAALNEALEGLPDETAAYWSARCQRWKGWRSSSRTGIRDPRVNAAG